MRVRNPRKFPECKAGLVIKPSFLVVAFVPEQRVRSFSHFFSLEIPGPAPNGFCRYRSCPPRGKSRNQARRSSDGAQQGSTAGAQARCKQRLLLSKKGRSRPITDRGVSKRWLKTKRLANIPERVVLCARHRFSTNAMRACTLARVFQPSQARCARNLIRPVLGLCLSGIPATDEAERLPAITANRELVDEVPSDFRRFLHIASFRSIQA